MTKDTQPTILVFDSGVGGLTVYQEIKNVLPNCNYIYCSDNAFFPYSEKNEDIIIQRVLAVCGHLNSLHTIDVIVIACNTASTIVLPSLREKFSDIAIVGTVPAIKPAAVISHNKCIGLLATKGTVNRAYTHDLIQSYANNCEVLLLGSTELVEIAEDKLHGKTVDLEIIRKIVSPWCNKTELDTVVLGCTHFPLLVDELMQCLPQVRNFIDSGEAIAKRVKTLLGEYVDKHPTYCYFYLSKKIEEQNIFQQTLNKIGFEQLLFIENE